MISEQVTLGVPEGLHLRPANRLCNIAIGFQSSIVFRVRGSDYNAKSVLSTLGACIRFGDAFEIRCDGPDEQEALKAMCDAVRGELT